VNHVRRWPERWQKNSDKVAYNEHVASSIARRIASYSTLFGINFSLVEGQTADVSQGFPGMGRFLLFKDTGRASRLIFGSLPAIGISTGFALRNFPLAKQGYKQ
jgi:hypothetical protein